MWTAQKPQELPCALCSSTGGKPLPRTVGWLWVGSFLDVSDEDTEKALGVECPGGEAPGDSWEGPDMLGHLMMTRGALLT